MISQPSPNGSNGRASNGTFAKGNTLGQGNPHGSAVNRLRTLLLESVTDDDLKAVVSKLVTMAKGGDLAAIKELFDRLLGKPPAAVEVEVAAGLSTEEARVSLASIRERLLAKK